MSKPEDWCAVCCTRHTAVRDCPGNLLATGPERHARKFTVTQGKRLEYYGVLIAEAGELWRARIFTYPNMLWSVPGGRGTIKFVGANPAEAEARAIEFLREHCEQREFVMVEAGDERVPGQVEPEDSDRSVPRRAKEVRYPCRVQVRFGMDKARRPARTSNLSANGLFVVTNRPVPEGQAICLLFDLEDCALPLIGTVVWVRPEEPGKPGGMGIQLDRPPALYRGYVEEVRQALATLAEEEPSE